MIRPSALGDVCRSVPLLVSLRRAYPNAEIDWLVQDSFVDAIRAHPALTSAVPFARGTLGRELRTAKLGTLRAFIKQLRSRRYDVVIDAQGLARSGFFAWVTRAPVRVGHADARELGWLMVNRRVSSDQTHTVDRMLDLLSALDVEPVRDLRLHCTQEDRATAEQRFGETHPVVLAPTSRWPAKRWPADRWALLADRLLAQGVGPLAVVGGPGEESQCAALLECARSREGIVDLVGATSVGQLMATIERSRLVIANDSAALHMAVGFDRPLVGLFGPTDLTRVGPYGRDVDVLQHIDDDQSFDHKNEANVALMERISVEETLGAAMRRLSRASARTLS